MDETVEGSRLGTSSHVIDDFNKDGVVLIKQMFDVVTIQILSKEVDAIRKIILQKIQGMERPIKKYSDIVERELGRLDFRCGFTASIFDEVAKPIVKLTKMISPQIDFRHYWGAIPSLSGAGPTTMHRDVYPILNTTVGENLTPFDISLPPYYLTVLLPLVEITEKNGPTQFIKGSHRKPVVRESDEAVYTPLPVPGDLLIFDGRALHQGAANLTDQERIVAYMTFVANWYHDQTFSLNDYLFPEMK